MKRRKIAARSRKRGRFTVWEKKCLGVRADRVQRGFLSERKRKFSPWTGAEDRNDPRTKSVRTEVNYQTKGVN